jgi:AAA+ ATPase superfamily predicted ATPase
LYFDERPKSSRKDLYDMREELEQLLTALNRKDPLIVIVGLRRIGKTSLLQTALSEVENNIVFDLRTLGTGAYSTKKDLVEILERSINDFLARRKTVRTKIIDALRHVSGVEVEGMSITFSWGGKESLDMAGLFKKLDHWALSNNTTIAVAFDEAQELRKVAGLAMDKFLAHIYDYCKATSIILTGSAVGLLYNFLGEEDPEAALYGRSRTEIRLKRLAPEEAEVFLRKGFKQAKKRVNDALIQDAVRRLDGIVGWLTMFGAACLKRSASAGVINSVMLEGSKLARREFENFLQGREVARKRYENIIGHLAKGASTWSSIKAYLELQEEKRLNDRKVTELIDALLKAGFIERIDELYAVSDPMLAHSFE